MSLRFIIIICYLQPVEHSLRQPTRPAFTTGALAGDTLVHCLGALVEEVLGCHFDLEHGVVAYEHTLRCLRAPQAGAPVEHLIATGMDEGHVAVFACPERDEFRAQIVHTAFRAELLATFEMPQAQLSGLLVTDFVGAPEIAVPFARVFRRRVQVHRSGQSPTTYRSGAFWVS